MPDLSTSSTFSSPSSIKEPAAISASAQPEQQPTQQPTQRTEALATLAPSLTYTSKLPNKILKAYDQGLTLFPRKPSQGAHEGIAKRRQSGANDQESLHALGKQLGSINLETLVDVEPLLRQYVTSWCDLSPQQQQELTFKYKREAIQRTPVFALYQALIQRDPDHISLEVMDGLSQQQFTRILDFHVWNGSEVDIHKAMHWLSMYQEMGDQVFYNRFSLLEEEYQIAILQPWLRGYTAEEFEDLAPQIQDHLIPFPGGSCYYHVLSHNPRIRDFVIGCFNALQASNMEYALSLLWHITWMPPRESESLAFRFRTSRNEEDGFLPFDAAQKSLFSLSAAMIRQLETTYMDHHFINQENTSLKGGSHQLDQHKLSQLNKLSMLRRVLAYVNFQMDRGSSSPSQQNTKAATLLYLEDLQNQWQMCTNHYIAALGLEPHHIKERETIMEHILASISLSLDVLSAGRVAIAASILEEQPSKVLLQYGEALTTCLRDQLTDALKKMRLLPSAFSSLVSQKKYGLVMDALDQHLAPILAPKDFMRLKGLFNRFPLTMQVSPPKTSSRRTQTDHNTPSPSFFHISIYSFHHLVELAHHVVSLIWRIEMALKAQVHHPQTSQPVDDVWMKALVNVCLGKGFISRVFDKDVFKKLLATPVTLRKKRLEAFQKELSADMPHMETDSPIKAILEFIHHPSLDSELSSTHRTVMEENKIPIADIDIKTPLHHYISSLQTLLDRTAQEPPHHQVDYLMDSFDVLGNISSPSWTED
ncbi:MAG: DUF6178 family protein [Proteobacteria bacterium]|nr:DUF6178 family protein [Pseudomonadota bacterium]